MPERLLRRLLARLDASPLPITDPVRLELEAELIAFIGAERAPPRSGTFRRARLV